MARVFGAEAACSIEHCLRTLHQLEANGYGWWAKDRLCIGTGAFPLGSFFNHSCSANVGRLQKCERGQPPRFEYYALADIEPGAPANVFYTRPDQVTSQRQATLLRSYNFKCDCWRCTSSGSSEEMSRENSFLTAILCSDENCLGVVVYSNECGQTVCSSCGVVS
eukprot:TRINITY_DN50031_c0_g2_i1.p2 TRINITY_DN50031_c0_g2~~TRINITY_DN50031_c0_g2_i1.p2  ORF type:complete len:165 (+),score=19.17 TRINITY_DN50031_c0_g2_i1:167-661(+)